MTGQELWNLQRKQNFGYCNIDKYHAQGFKGKEINFLNLETSEHGDKVCKVFSEVAPESKVFKGYLSGTTNGTPLTNFNITVDGVKQDFETFVIENKIKIINCSRENGHVQVLSDFMKKYIIDKHNVILCNSAGNDYTHVSGSFYDVGICVGAVDYKNGVPVRATYSGQGEKVDFVAFAHLFNGTSFSSPFLAGMIALLLCKYGDFNQYECVEILKGMCVDLGKEGDDDYFGWGIPTLSLEDELQIIVGGSKMVFKDVEETRWSKNAIDFAVEKGILIGFEDGTFRPAETVTREQLAIVIQRILTI